ncbi:MAG: cytochrome c-type biogenesis protein [Actinomycetota bacterium]
MTTASRQWVSWAALVVVVVGTLVVGALRDGPQSDADRSREIKETVQCPVCNGQNVLESNAPVATIIREEIDRRITDGWTDAQIRGLLSETYGEFVLLTPSASGVTSLVWILPIAGLALGTAGLGIVFARWRETATVDGPSEEDRRLVAEARALARVS